MSSVLLIIAKQGFQDVELEGTKKGLGDVSVTIGSAEVGDCVGKFGGIVTADIALRDVNVSSYGRIAYIGGPGAGALKDDPDALRIAREAIAKKMPLGAICIAPTILAAAGVLDGKNATVWNKDGEQSVFLEKHGAHYTGEDVTVDGFIVTGNGPDAAVAFGEALAAI